MITFDEALERILQKIEPLPPKKTRLQDLLGNVLAEPIVATIDSPPFDNSAVDGFGVRLTDVATATDDSPATLTLSAVVRAGDLAAVKLAPRGALKILTGACVPASVDAVVMKEYCSENNGHVEVKCSAKPGENIRRRGDEFLRGQVVLPAGVVATPPVVGLVASLGYSSFAAIRKPKAAVITTGNELTRPGRELLPGRIFDSNSYAMSAALQSLGVEDVLKLHAREDLASTKSVFRSALAAADIVISTGGVSVGDYDHVKDALEALGVETHVWRIAIKPGKPVYFGVLTDKRTGRNKYVFGLPGNPVSALVTFNRLVVPALKKLRGISDESAVSRLSFTAELTKTIKKKAGRMEFVRGRLYKENGANMVAPTVGQDSHMLSGLANANALIVFPLEAERLEAGSTVEVELLSWNAPA